ncbi:hypothetical protein C3L33_22693, partial [Rhododendron williamsianum]
TREERLEIIEELTQRRELLKGEIEAVKSYYNKLRAINLDLKAKKRELETCKKFGIELREFNRVMGPLCIPDLNASASGETFGVGSSQPLDRSSRGLVVVELDDNKARAQKQGGEG